MKKPVLLSVTATLCCAAMIGGVAVEGTAASGATLGIAVKDAKGMPVRDAVVMVYPKSGSSGTYRTPGGAVVEQRDIEFDPGTLIVAKGTTVAFPNRDKVRHNVYSFSKAAKFEIKLYGKDETRSQNFPIAGTVALGCNIHDQMRGYVKVVDTPYAAKTDHNGMISISGLPGGATNVRVWHPDNRVKDGESIYDITVARSGVTERVSKLNLRR